MTDEMFPLGPGVAVLHDFHIESLRGVRRRGNPNRLADALAFFDTAELIRAARHSAEATFRARASLSAN